MVRTLFIKVPHQDLGTVLEPKEAPLLWKLCEEVAAVVGTRRVDEIRISPALELCVYERGTWREKMTGRAARVLVLGIATFEDFKIDEFRAVLAHEYAHFQGGETAGGLVALRVSNDIRKFHQALLREGLFTWYNPTTLFVALYYYVLKRISVGARRLHEVIADRVAAQHYGARALEGGLRHVIRRSVFFERWSESESKAALKQRRRITHLYEAPVFDDKQLKSLENVYKSRFERPAKDDESHPGPFERVHLIAGFQERSQPAVEGQVWQLFNDPNKIKAWGEWIAELSLAPRRDLEDPTPVELGLRKPVTPRRFAN